MGERENQGDRQEQRGSGQAEKPSHAGRAGLDPQLVRRALDRRRTRNAAAHLTPEEQQEYVALCQKAQELRRQRLIAVDRAMVAYAQQHGGNYSSEEQLKPSLWRELRDGAAWQLWEPIKMLGRGVYGAAKRNAVHTQAIMDESRERGVPMNPIGASMAAFATDTAEDVRTSLAEATEDLRRAVEAETAAEKAKQAFEYAKHIGAATLSAYSIVEPVASFGDAAAGAAGGGGLATATAGATGSMAATSAAPAAAASAPVGPAAGAGVASQLHNEAGDHNGGKVEQGKEAESAAGEAAGGEAKAGSSADSVADKLKRYLLNPSHPVGKSKAAWFKQALGFDESNMAELASQIVFDEGAAVPTAATEFGQKFNQTIAIRGANGKTIEVVFAWIKNKDGVARLVTAIPAKK